MPFFFFKPITNILCFLTDAGLPRKNVDLYISDIDGEVPFGWPLTLTTVTEVPDQQQSAHADEHEKVGDSGTINVDKIMSTCTHPEGDRVNSDERYTSIVGAEAAASEDSLNEGRDKASRGHVRQSVENAQENFEPKQIRDDAMGRDDNPSRNSQAIETQADDPTPLKLLDHDRLVDPPQSHAGMTLPSALHMAFSEKGPRAGASRMDNLRRSPRVASALSPKMPKTLESKHVQPHPARTTITNSATRNKSKRNALKTQNRARSNYPADVGSSKSRPIEIDMDIEMIAVSLCPKM